MQRFEDSHRQHDQHVDGDVGTEEDDGTVEEEEDEPQITEEELSEEIGRYRLIVLSACSSLGNLQPDPSIDKTKGNATDKKMVYIPHDECLASLKDIKRYIQMDEQGKDKWVLQWLGEWNVLKTDILPIFSLYAKQLLPGGPRLDRQRYLLPDPDRDHIIKTTMICVELLVFMTWNMDSESEEVKQRFIQVLRSYKRAFANSEVVFSLISIAVMYMRRSHRSDKENLLVKGIMYIFRNVLAIPDPLISPTSTDSSQLLSHDKLLVALDKELAIDFFLTLTSSAAAKSQQLKELRPVLLDIVYYIFYRVPTAALFEGERSWFINGSGSSGSNHNSNNKRIGRHNNFGGVYAVSTDEGTIMPVFNIREVLRPFANLFKKQARIRKPREQQLMSVDREWRVIDPDSIPILRRAAAVFIESCYNPFIGALFEDARHGITVMEEASPRLLYMAAYFVDISIANSAIELGCTCTLAQAHVFGQVMRNTSVYMDMRQWSQLEQAIYCIQQTMVALGKMRGTKLDSLSDYVLSNVFYDGDTLDLFVRLSKAFRPTFHSRKFLEQMVELTETFLTALKTYAESKVSLMVQKRVKKRATKKKEEDEKKPEEKVKDESDEEAMADVEEEEEEEGSDEEEDQETLVEREFNISRYENAFASAAVVKAYSHLLAPPSSSEHVYPMIYRIAVTCQKPHLFFKKQILMRLLALFNERFTFPHYAEMLDLAAWIFRQYVTVINSPALNSYYRAEALDNKLAMECMLTFLKESQLGTTIKPTITRHVIDLLADPDNGPRVDDVDDDIIDDEPSVLRTAPAGDGRAEEETRQEEQQFVDDFDIDDLFLNKK